MHSVEIIKRSKTPCVGMLVECKNNKAGDGFEFCLRNVQGLHICPVQITISVHRLNNLSNHAHLLLNRNSRPQPRLRNPLFSDDVAFWDISLVDHCLLQCQ
jgi:hypothetical protein